jgi:hypothetical protein
MNRNKSQIKNSNHNFQASINTNKPSTSDLQDTVVEMKFLALSWLDDFEKDLFEGKTLDELIGRGKHV